MSLYSQTSVPYQDQISENSQKNNGPSDVLGYYAYDSDDELQNSIVKVEFEYNQIIVDVINAFIVGLFLSIVGIGILMILCLPLIFIYGVHVYNRRKCYITSTNVVLKQEIPVMVCCLFNKRENHVQLYNVVDVIVTQGVIQRMFDCYTLTILNPGQAGPEQSSSMQLFGVKNAHQIKRMLLDLSAKLKSGEKIEAPTALSVAANSSDNHHMGYQAHARVHTEHSTLLVDKEQQQQFMSTVVDINQSLKRIEQLLASQQQQPNV